MNIQTERVMEISTVKDTFWPSHDLYNRDCWNRLIEVNLLMM